MVDPDVLLRKLAELELYLRQASEYRSITVEQYQDDWKVQRIVERTLHMALEACLDLASHVVSDRKIEVPGTYAGMFEALGRAGLLDDELVRVLVRMTGFRNVLVHEYTRLDARIVVRVLREHLADLERYCAAVRTWI